MIAYFQFTIHSHSFQNSMPPVETQAVCYSLSRDNPNDIIPVISWGFRKPLQHHSRHSPPFTQAKYLFEADLVVHLFKILMLDFGTYADYLESVRFRLVLLFVLASPLQYV